MHTHRKDAIASEATSGRTARGCVRTIAASCHSRILCTTRNTLKL